MDFYAVLDEMVALLRQRGRVTYGALKRQFKIDDEYLADLKAELIEGQQVAIDEGGKVLVWKGVTEQETGAQGIGESAPKRTSSNADSGIESPMDQRLDTAERRQLTVMFCDLVGSTALSAQLDPEDLRAVVQRYQQACTKVVQQHDGYIAQYLGDGLLVYFGYPTAHEDDARRAVRAGLEIVQELRSQVPSPLRREGQGEGENCPQGQETPHPSPLPQGARGLQVRIGIHTGLVVVGEMGAAGRREQLALGETPNIAARLQGLADPNTVIISAATQRLIEEQFESQPFGSHVVKGLDTPIAVYHVQSERQSASPLASRRTLTPLVGREREVGLLLDRWEQVKESRGQVVLLSGEPGIGKSRLAYTLREHVTAEGSLLFEARCSPYHQQSAFYPLIDVLQRTLLFTRQETDADKIGKLGRALALYNLQEHLPLFTALLSLPTPSTFPPLQLTPQKQKERTLHALLQLLVAQAGRQATVSVWEDFHWADPSSLEFLSSLVEQIPTTKLLLVLTFRPEFIPPWKPRSHISQLVLNRLGKKQVEAMIERVAVDTNLPAEVIEQIRLKTDGVPLFVEELTKSVVEAGGAVGGQSPTLPPLAIPATLQETLLARLDRLSEARQVAQLGAILGREFSYDLLQAVAPFSDTALQSALRKLVEAEILYQRGSGEQARYVFKHALIQDTAYQSLLKSMRQQYHQQIAQVLEEQFPATAETQPELLAHHYTKATLLAQAIPYWRQAGQKAMERSASIEAIAHFTQGLALLKTQPDTPERVQDELTLLLALGVPLSATKGFGAIEVENTYARARVLCQQVPETPQFFTVLWGLWHCYLVRAEHRTACTLGEQLLRLAQRTGDPALSVVAHYALGVSLTSLGELTLACTHLEQGIAQYNLQQHHSLAFLYWFDPGVGCLFWRALALWLLGYPEQALRRCYEALALAQELAHPLSRIYALGDTAWLHQLRREQSQAHEQAMATTELAHAQGFPLWLAWGTLIQGWVLVEEGRTEEGLAQLHQGVMAFRATGAEQVRAYCLALLAEAQGKSGQIEEGLTILTEALGVIAENGERWWEAEAYRLQGELLRHRTAGNKQHAAMEAAAEASFHQALHVARHQQAKSLELRAAMSLSRLWQRQGKQQEAHQLLAEIYGWFTEGFETKDLQEAKALLAELAEGQ